VIRGQNYHIVYCHQRYAEVAPSFDEVKEELMREIVESKIDNFFYDEIGKLMDRELPRFNIQADLFRPAEE
jgi:hypothetical protein